MSNAGTIRVLHVDDEPDFADMAATFLERENDRITVQTANSPAAGLERLSERKFDCIVSDYDMPAQNGIEFLDAVREEYSELPFILYTGKGSEEIASEAISAGVTDYLQKESGTGQYPVLANRISNAVEQYHSRQAVQKTERKLSELAERTDDVLFMFDGDWGELLFVNSTYEEIWGASTEELEDDPSSFLKRVHPDDEDRVRESMDRLSSGEPSQIEYRILRREDEQRWVRVDSQPILDEDGNVVRIVGQVCDITEQKEHELHLETIIDNLPGYVYRHKYDSEYPLHFVKGDAESVTGYTATELEDDVVLAGDIIHPDDRQNLWAENIEEIEATGRFDSTYRIITKDGDVRWIQDQGQLVEDPVTGDAVIDGFITDVSDHIQREQELRNQRLFIEESLDALQDAFYAINEDEELLRWNDRVSAISGYTDDEIDEMDVAALFVDEHRDRIRESISETMETGSSVIRADVLTADGERIPYEFRETRLDDPNRGEAIAVGVGRDISDQVKRERELERIRDLFTEAERLGNLGAWEFDMDGNVLWTDGTRRIHEVDEEFTPTIADVLTFPHPEDREMIQRAVADALENEGSYELELRVNTAKGNQRWIRTRGKVLTDEGSQTVRGFTQDITEQKERVRELQREHERFRAVFEKAFDAMVIANDDGEYIDANQSATELLGLPEDELLGRTIVEFAPDDFDFDEAWNRFQQSDKDRGTFPLVRADGTERIVEYAATANIAPGQHLSVLRDVTPQKEQERRLTALNEVSQELMTADTREEVTEIGVEAAARVIGLDINAIHLYDERAGLVPVAETDLVSEVIGDLPTFTGGDSIAWRAYERGEAFVVDDVHADPDLYNPETPIKSELYLPLDEYGLLIAGSDTPEAFDQRDLAFANILAGGITAALEQVERTEELRAREQESARQNKRLEQFANVVSHDLRNPLTVAEGRLELARDDCDSEHLDDVSRAHERMNLLIGDLLTLAREGEEVGEFESVDVGDLVESCWQNVESADATLVVDVESTIRADSSRLQQLVENLMRNAIEHGGEDVTITVGTFDDGFYVEDDGPGIPEADRDEVFEAGYSTSEDGTGFGLSIVERVADAHGWEIGVADGSDGGARFELTGVTFVTE